MAELPAWFSETSDKRKQNRRSARQERAYAEENGGRVQAGSGSSWRAPEDVVTDEEIVQIKYTYKERYTLDGRELERLRGNSLRRGREGKLVIDFAKLGIRAVVTVEDAPRGT